MAFAGSYAVRQAGPTRGGQLRVPDESEVSLLTRECARSGTTELPRLCGRDDDAARIAPIVEMRERATHRYTASLSACRSTLRDDVDAQRVAAGDDREQAVDIRVRAGAVACVGGVLREHREAVLGSLSVERAEGLLQVVVDRERTLFAGLVFDAGDHVAVRADEIDARDAVDGRQLREVVLEYWGSLNH